MVCNDWMGHLHLDYIPQKHVDYKSFFSGSLINTPLTSCKNPTPSFILRQVSHREYTELTMYEGSDAPLGNLGIHSWEWIPKYANFPSLKFGEIYVYCFYPVATHWCAILNASSGPACQGWPLASSHSIYTTTSHHCSHAFFLLWHSICAWRMVTIPPSTSVVQHHSRLEPISSLRAADRCVNWTFRSQRVKLAWRELWWKKKKKSQSLVKSLVISTDLHPF